jgi:hypothetical protein
VRLSNSSSVMSCCSGVAANPTASASAVHQTRIGDQTPLRSRIEVVVVALPAGSVVAQRLRLIEH